jgi:hypothetical protein
VDQLAEEFSACDVWTDLDFIGNWLQLGLCLDIWLKVQLEFFPWQTEFFFDGASKRSINLSRIQLRISSEFL